MIEPIHHIWVIEMIAALGIVLGYAIIALINQRGHWDE